MHSLGIKATASRVSVSSSQRSMQKNSSGVWRSACFAVRQKSCRGVGYANHVHAPDLARGVFEVNVEPSSKSCTSCEDVRMRLGATRNRLAMWCSACYSKDQRASQKCFQCYQCKCNHCGKSDVEFCKKFKCSEGDCGVSFSLCVTCFPYLSGREVLQCKSCWHKGGLLCMLCHKII